MPRPMSPIDTIPTVTGLMVKKLFQVLDDSRLFLGKLAKHRVLIDFYCGGAFASFVSLPTWLVVSLYNVIAPIPSTYTHGE